MNSTSNNQNSFLQPRDAWDSLSLEEQAAMMKVAVQNGIYNLKDIRQKYNEFAEGGSTDTDWSYNSWKKQIAEHMGIRPDEDNTYDYEAYFRKYPEEAWKMLSGDPTAHFSDEFKTVYHPTFSSKSIGNDGSIYSGIRNPKTNPQGLVGGTWSPDYHTFTMSPDGYRGPVSMDDRKWYLENAEDNGVQLREADGSLPVYDGIPWGGVLPNIIINGSRRSRKFEDGGFTSELDWSPDSWFSKRVAKPDGTLYNNEEAARLASHVPEYNNIEQTAKANGTWLKMSDGSTWKGDPRSWVMMQSEAYKKNYSPKPWYTGQAEWPTTFDYGEGKVDTNKVTRAPYYNNQMWFSDSKDYGQTFADYQNSTGLGWRFDTPGEEEIKGHNFLSAIPKEGNYRTLESSANGRPDQWQRLPFVLEDGTINRLPESQISVDSKGRNIRADKQKVLTDDVVNWSKDLGDQGIFMQNIDDGAIIKNGEILRQPVNEFISQPGFTDKVKFIEGNTGDFDIDNPYKYANIIKAENDPNKHNVAAYGGNLFAPGGSTDDDLVDWIIREEGFNKKPENIGDGKMTLGSGLTAQKWHDLYKKKGNKWSAEDNRRAVKEEVANRRRWAERNIPNWDTLPSNSQKALLSYKYNFDFNASNSPKLFQALRDSNLPEAARQMNATSKNPIFKKGLQARRQREQQWFLSDVAPQAPQQLQPIQEQPVSTAVYNPFLFQAENTTIAPQMIPNEDSYVEAHQLTEAEDRRNKLQERWDAINKFNNLMNLISIENNTVPEYTPKNAPFVVQAYGGPLVEAAMNEYRNGGKIHIKPSHRGRLTDLKKRTGKTEAELYKTGGPAVRKMITFARNARKWKHGLGGNLFKDGGANIFRRPDGTYFYQASPDDDEVTVTPKIALGDDPTYWTYTDENGKLYTPQQSFSTNTSELKSENRNSLERWWDNYKGEALNGVPKGYHTLPAIGLAAALPVAGEAFAGTTLAGIPATTWADAALTAGFAGHGLNHAINEDINGLGDAAMTALEIAPLGRLAKPIAKETALAIENYRYPLGRSQVPNGELVVSALPDYRGGVKIDFDLFKRLTDRNNLKETMRNVETTSNNIDITSNILIDPDKRFMMFEPGKFINYDIGAMSVDEVVNTFGPETAYYKKLYDVAKAHNFEGKYAKIGQDAEYNILNRFAINKADPDVAKGIAEARGIYDIPEYRARFNRWGTLGDTFVDDALARIDGVKLQGLSKEMPIKGQHGVHGGAYASPNATTIGITNSESSSWITDKVRHEANHVGHGLKRQPNWMNYHNEKIRPVVREGKTTNTPLDKYYDEMDEIVERSKTAVEYANKIRKEGETLDQALTRLADMTEANIYNAEIPADIRQSIARYTKDSMLNFWKNFVGGYTAPIGLGLTGYGLFNNQKALGGNLFDGTSQPTQKGY